MSRNAAWDVFCPAPECTSVSAFGTVEGLRDHLEEKHDGKSLRQLRKEADKPEGDDA